MFQQDIAMCEQGWAFFRQHETPVKLLDLLLSLWAKHYVTSGMDLVNLVSACVIAVENMGHSAKRKEVAFSLLEQAFQRLFRLHTDHTIETHSKYKIVYLHNQVTEDQFQNMSRRLDSALHERIHKYAHPSMIPYMQVWAFSTIHKVKDQSLLMLQTLLNMFAELPLHKRIDTILNKTAIPEPWQSHVAALMWKTMGYMLHYMHEPSTLKVYKDVLIRMSRIFFWKMSKKAAYERFTLMTTFANWMMDTHVLNNLKQYPFPELLPSEFFVNATCKKGAAASDPDTPSMDYLYVFPQAAASGPIVAAQSEAPARQIHVQPKPRVKRKSLLLDKGVLPSDPIWEYYEEQFQHNQDQDQDQGRDSFLSSSNA